MDEAQQQDHQEYEHSEPPIHTGPVRQYEFDEHENQVFSDMSQAMKTVGYFMLVLGPLRILIGLLAMFRGEYLSAAGQVVEGACFFMIGNWTGDASGSFRRIVESRGADITHLMSSMVDLKKIYGLQRAVLGIAIAAVSIGLVVGVLMGIGSHGSTEAKTEGKSETAEPTEAQKKVEAPKAAPVVAPAAEAQKPVAAPAAAAPPVVAAPAQAAPPAAAPAPEPAAEPAHGKHDKGHHHHHH